MMGSRFILCVLSLCIFALVVASDHPSSLLKLFEGEWNLQITDYGDKIETQDSNVMFNVTSKNNVHQGAFVDFERDLHLKVFIDWTTMTSGEVRYIDTRNQEEDESDDESTGSLLFEFDFTNRTNGYFYSAGPFKGLGESKSVYQFVVTSHVAFVFSLYRNDGHFTTVTGTKALPPPERTLFQQYGTLAMLGVFLVFRAVSNRFLPTPPAPTTTTPTPASKPPTFEKKKN
eukprot:TRINITY_DN4352_c0_g1_i1.p1 TRINITY_DN4352_c0_g1~~TRINITY_DN4352_c0_g1_i1.p1  ORF type:complete len:230 (-),score=54.53 TRINITY_DN4352_c0_g1_i1:58-747(-)